jgi:hypothetical protein
MHRYKKLLICKAPSRKLDVATLRDEAHPGRD